MIVLIFLLSLFIIYDVTSFGFPKPISDYWLELSWLFTRTFYTPKIVFAKVVI